MAKVDWEGEKYDSGRDFSIMPKGQYLALVKDSTVKKTRNNDGKYFEFEFEVHRPEEFRKRKLWSRANVHNKSQEAERIGREQFNALVEATGTKKGTVRDTAQLHGKWVVLFVDIAKNNRDEDVNEVKGYRAPSPDAKFPTVESSPRAAPRREEPKAEESQREPGADELDEDDIPF